ncbi:MAG: peptidoglycan bridge formation glycyltransferase FemA/FemB family protein [Pelolinea sp.]|nr:peptidoglycan bridge formation glycyltransferase FemA/FemB family protein [Pelolinea sp.]
MTIVSKEIWDEFLTDYPDAHILQTSAWGTFKENHGWYPKWVITDDAGAQVLFKRLPFGQTFAYIPKGPVGKDWNAVIAETIALSKQENAFILYIEPDLWEKEFPDTTLRSAGFNSSQLSIQPRRTISLSLTGGEQTWLKNMKQKTRYNIRLAQKKEIYIQRSNNIDVFTDLIKVTGSRDDFGVHSSQYYQDVFEKFSKNEDCVLLIATFENKPLAGLMVFTRGNRAWYFYGASNNMERNRMPTYLLQLEGMKWAASKGCTEYDLWGIPDEDLEILEKDFMQRSDGLWGVYRFKRGFGGDVNRTAGVFQKVLKKPLYLAYSVLLKIRK